MLQNCTAFFPQRRMQPNQRFCSSFRDLMPADHLPAARQLARLHADTRCARAARLVPSSALGRPSRRKSRCLPGVMCGGPFGT